MHLDSTMVVLQLAAMSYPGRPFQISINEKNKSLLYWPQSEKMDCVSDTENNKELLSRIYPCIEKYIHLYGCTDKTEVFVLQGVKKSLSLLQRAYLLPEERVASNRWWQTLQTCICFIDRALKGGVRRVAVENAESLCWSEQEYRMGVLLLFQKKSTQVLDDLYQFSVKIHN